MNCIVCEKKIEAAGAIAKKCKNCHQLLIRNQLFPCKFCRKLREIIVDDVCTICNQKPKTVNCKIYNHALKITFNLKQNVKIVAFRPHVYDKNGFYARAPQKNRKFRRSFRGDVKKVR